MALFLPGQACPLCGQPLTEGQPRFATWGVWLGEDDPAARFCDSVMHWDCYARWGLREHFAGSYFEFWIAYEKENPFWHSAYLDDEVLVTINPSEPVAAAWVVLRGTGSRVEVKLKLWESWLSGEGEAVHPLFDRTLRQARAALKEHRPTVAALVAGIDEPRKLAVIERYQAAQQQKRAEQREVQRHVNQHNAACNRLMDTIERQGLRCPHCGKHSKNYRLSKRKGKRSAIICRRCGWTVEASDVSNGS